MDRGPFQSYVAFFWPKSTLNGRIAVQPSLLNFLSPKKMSTIYTLSKLWTFQKNINKVNPIPVTAMQRFEIFKN